jgi:predicted amidophosphoribosyltransferase
LIVAGGVIAFTFITRNKNDDDEDEEEGGNCPVCGQEMEFKSDFEKYYCKNCGRYR